MADVPSAYSVRVRVTGAGGEGTFHAAQTLASKLARENPGLTFEVTQDKVWMSVRCRVPGGKNDDTQEL